MAPTTKYHSLKSSKIFAQKKFISYFYNHYGMILSIIHVIDKTITMSRNLLLVSFCILLGLSCASHKKQLSIEENISKQINKIIRYENPIDTKHTPGFIVSILEADTSFTVGFGTYKDSTLNALLHLDFDIGAISKCYLDVLTEKLVQKDILQDELVLREVFPQLRKTRIGNLSLSKLRQQQTGIPRTLPYFEHIKQQRNSTKLKAFEAASFDDLYTALLKFEEDLKDSTFTYSHHNHALIAAIIEHETTKSIRSLYQEHLPYLNYPKKNNQHTDGYDRKLKLSQKINYGDYESVLGAEANMKDLIDFARLNYLTKNSKITQRNCVKDMLHPGIDYCTGLYRSKVGKHHTIYGHGGRSNRHSASIHVVPETKTGVIILSNSQVGTKQLYLHVLAMINDNWKRKNGKKKE